MTLLRPITARTAALLATTALVVSASAVTSTVARAQQKIDRQMPLNAMGLLRITNLLGSVRVTGWDKDSVSVSGSAGAGVQFYMGGSPVGVKLGVEGGKGAPETADLVLRVPVRARLWIRTTDGDVDVTSFSGDLDIAAVSSRVRVKGTLKQANVESIDGDVDMTASPDYLRIRTGGGRVTWSGSSEDAAITTVGGGITAAAGTVTRGRFESVTGDVRFSGSTPRTGSLAFDTHSGDIAVALGRDVSADVTAASSVGIDLFGKQSAGKLGDAPQSVGRTLGANGQGGATIVARSFKGKIVFTQP